MSSKLTNPLTQYRYGNLKGLGAEQGAAVRICTACGDEGLSRSNDDVGIEGRSYRKTGKFYATAKT